LSPLKTGNCAEHLQLNFANVYGYGWFIQKTSNINALRSYHCCKRENSYI